MRITNTGLGIGTDSPVSNLEIAKNDQTNGATLSITNSFSGSSWDAGDIIGTIDFRSDDSSTTEPIRGQIKVFDDSASGSTFAAFNAMSFSTANTNVLTERMRLTSAGLLGLGTSSPDTSVHITTAMSSSPSSVIYLDNSGTNTAGGGGAIIFNSSATAGTTTNFNASIKGVRDSNDNGSSELQFFTTHQATDNAAAKRVVITSEGDVLMNCTSVPSGSGGGAAFETSGTLMRLKQSAPTTSSTKVQLYYNGNGEVGSIATSGSSTAFNTSSDYRLKENVVDMTDALERVDNLKPKRFNFIADAETTVDGFIAHEVSDVVPEAITGDKDAMQSEEYEETPAVYEEIVHEAKDAIEWEDKPTMDNTKIEIQEWLYENNIEWQSSDTKQQLLVRIPQYKQEPKEASKEQVLVSEAVMATRSVPVYQAIDQSKLVPLLVGAIKELKARIEVLENS